MLLVRVDVSEVFKGMCKEIVRVARDEQLDDERRKALELDKTSSLRLGSAPEAKPVKECCF